MMNMVKVPVVGSIVEVIVRFQNIHFVTYKNQPFEDFKITGTVIKSDRWVPADCFSINTDNRVAIIPTKRIVGMKVISGSVESSIRKFKVRGSKEYTVTLSQNRFTCECVGFKYYSKCKHTEAVKKALKSTT